jgi:putative Ca2+/H+ antiporter (TMEM165/GDT1 family)
MQAFLASLAFVVLAEMGDKTQLLAMAFACRFRWQTVLWAVFWATAANHLLATVVGKALAAVVPLDVIRAVAAASFILFGLWTVRGDRLEGEENRSGRSPFWTVAVAFFIAEMGDKTQLATVSLAVEYNAILTVWMGTTTGMLIADAFGILVGIVMGRHIPERAVKWGAALVFIGFGVWGLHESLPARVQTPAAAAALAAAVALGLWGANRLGRPQDSAPKPS